MYNEPQPSPLRENVKFWNNTAKECYENGCNCKKCLIFEDYFKDKDYFCHMKYYVYYLLKKLGKPV